MTASEDTLTLGVFSDDISTSENITEDDDIILASQAQRHQKIKIIEKTKAIKEADQLKSTKILHQRNSNESCCHLFSVESNELNQRFFENTQEDMFMTNLKWEKYNKVPENCSECPKKLQSENNKTIELKLNLISDKTQFIDTDFMNKLNSESLNRVLKPTCESIDKTLMLPIFSETIFSYSNGNEENKKDESPALFSNDRTLEKVNLSSHQDECLTSGIILPTQLQNNKKNISPALEPGMSKNSDWKCCKCEMDRNDEFCTNTETKTMQFTLSVSCLVVKCNNTKKIRKKSILSVSEGLESPIQCWNHSKPAKLRKCSFEDITQHKSSKGCCGNCDHSEGWKRENRESENDQKGSEFEDSVGNNAIEWANQCLLGAKLDELLQRSFSLSGEIRKMTERGKGLKSLAESLYGDTIHLEDEDLFPSGRLTDGNVLNASPPRQFLLETSVSHRNSSGEEKMAVLKPLMTPRELTLEKIEETSDEIEESKSENTSSKADSVEESSSPELDATKTFGQETSQENLFFVKGESVMALLKSDSYYHSGKLIEREVRNIWRIEFDDGQVESVSEDNIISWRLLKPGDLISVLNDGQYLPGKVTNISFGRSISCDVELDNGSNLCTMGKMNLSLTSVMAEKLKERFRLLKSNENSMDLSDRQKSYGTTIGRKNDPSENTTWTISRVENLAPKRRRYLDESRRLLKGSRGRAKTNYLSRIMGNRSKLSWRRKASNKRNKVRRSFYAGLPSN